MTRMVAHRYVSLPSIGAVSSRRPHGLQDGLTAQQNKLDFVGERLAWRPGSLCRGSGGAIMIFKYTLRNKNGPQPNKRTPYDEMSARLCA